MRLDSQGSDLISSAKSWLESHTAFSRPYDRRNMPLDDKVRRFFELAANKMGNPHESGFTISVAGSKGKGTVSHLLCRHLMNLGLATGLSLSPHLVDIRERALVNLLMPREEKLAQAIMDIAVIADGIPGRMTFSGVMSLAAMHMFSQERLDAQIIECGLGGEHDATGFISARLCILTSVELEHTKQLGNDTCAIAREKAGIATRGATLVCGFLGERELAEVEKVVRPRGANLVLADTRNLDARSANEKIASVALAEFGRISGIPTALADVSNYTVPGRDDLRHVGPATILFDGAHTCASLEGLAGRVMSRFARPPVLVFGCSPPRDPAVLGAIIRGLCSKLYYVPIGGSQPPDGFITTPFERLAEVFEQEDNFVVTGSFHLVGDVMKLLNIRPYGIITT